jgi:isopenicillin-N N-acyltransferase-like protein
MVVKKIYTRIFKIALIVFSILAILTGIFFFIVALHEPIIKNSANYNSLKRDSINNGWICGANWIHKNDLGLYEMYLEGSPYERGYINGLLSQELVKRQEDFFVHRLNQMLPSSVHQYLLKMFVLWFNKDLDENIPEEYKEEIFGVSQFASPDYSNIGTPYQRLLNYHGAHDIGHAMQNMNLVACSSFGLWNQYTKDSSILIGRNFDFYAGDEFAQEKIILFVKPDKGYSFMMVTWGGMTGVVSGMNEQGITITLNAAASDIPSASATPVSIVSRDILQYAKNIDDAFAIASKYKSFVSESFMIGSANDHKVVIIEKTPDTTIMYSATNDSRILCTNHFQSDYFLRDPVNIKNMNESPTVHRFNRLNQLLPEKKQFNELDAAIILRDRFGMNNADIGMSNENTLNQLVAHHSIIFNPDKRIVWVSSNPYQLGAFVAYDLKKIFSKQFNIKNQPTVYESTRTIPADSFLYSTGYQNYVYYKEINQKITESSFKATLSEQEIISFLHSNPEYFGTYLLTANYYIEHREYQKALILLKKAQTKVIPRKVDKDKIDDLIGMCTEHI